MQKFVIKLDPNKVGKAMWITPGQAERELHDGRVISRFSEYWASKIYGFEKASNTNEAGCDGYIKSGSLLVADKAVGVRSLTKSTGVKFQQSKFIGSGRDCSADDLLLSLLEVEFEIVVDITEAPTIAFIPVKTETLLDLHEKEILTCNGLPKRKFYNLLDIKLEQFEFIDVYQK